MIYMIEHPSGVWIGGTDRQVEGDWRWVTSGQRLALSHWNDGEPNNNWGGAEENCLKVSTNGLWYDNPDLWYNIIPSICEFIF